MNHLRRGNRGRSWTALIGAAALGIALAQTAAHAQFAADYAVQLSATVHDDPPAIVVTWPDGPTQTSDTYEIFRRVGGTGPWGEPLATAINVLEDGRRSFTDTAVEPGRVYEYKVAKQLPIKTTLDVNHMSYGYIWVGNRTPLVEHRGTLVLIVEQSITDPLGAEIARLQNDLIGDGWRVIRREVSRDDNVVDVKARIKEVYDADPRGVKAVFLLGRVPVPYSGNFQPMPPDGHTQPGDDHRGAWPADVFYADMDGEWTDSEANFVNLYSGRATNVPGDGKFDPSYLPSDVELQIGRVDLSALPGAGARRPYPEEAALLKQYLDRNHEFRHGRLAVRRKALVSESYDSNGGRAYAASGYRSFSTMFGPANIVVATTQLASRPEDRWISRLTSDSYTWVFGAGGGSNKSISGLGMRGEYNDVTAVDLVDDGALGVFHLYFGSWFGDWDQPDNIMRTSLITKNGLAAAWSGRPHLVFHPMALGETLGFCIRISQNNDLTYQNQTNTFRRGVHIALMGDPTLRLHPVRPPTEVQASASGGNVDVRWKPSASDVVGYHVYRAAAGTDEFVRLTDAPVLDTQFTDGGRGADGSIYMVRAIALEQSASGSYFNASQGIFAMAQ